MTYPDSFDSLSRPSPSTIRAASVGISPANTASAIILSLQNIERRLGLTTTATTFTADAGTDTLTANSHGLTNADVLALKTSSALPGGLAIDIPYYVVGATTNTFQLASSRGGSAIDITSAGTGTQSFLVLFSEGKILLSTAGATTSSWSSALSLASGSLILPQSASIAPTAEGSVGWDTDDDLLKIGTGAATKTFVDINSTQTLTGKTLTSPVINTPSITSPTITGWDGWQALSETVSVSSGYNKGNKEFDLTFSADMSAKLSAGMRLELTRGTTPPTQCTDLESSSSQYASKTSPAGLTFTDDFTCEAWVKLESYTIGGIVARRNADTEGWSFYITANGQVGIDALRIAVNNSSTTSYQSIPLGRWIHVAATVDLSGTSVLIYIDGILVPSATVITGTITALVQGTTALVVGAAKSAGTSPFDGKIADVRVWSAVRTATQIRDNMNQQRIGNESNLVGYFKLNGDFIDSTSNANTLTAQNSATATNVDNPMKSIEYAIVTKIATTTITVFTGTDYNIPNMTLSAPAYSTQKIPFGFPVGKDKWQILLLHRISSTQSSPTQNTWYNLGSLNFVLPTGSWDFSYNALPYANDTSGTTVDVFISLSTANNSESDVEFTSRDTIVGASGNILMAVGLDRNKLLSVSSATTYYLIEKISVSTTIDTLGLTGDTMTTAVRAECIYI